ncbi:MAG TPA: methyltransferase domain-containing protein [Xanthobacteraceae bacterium]
MANLRAGAIFEHKRERDLVAASGSALLKIRVQVCEDHPPFGTGNDVTSAEYFRAICRRLLGDRRNRQAAIVPLALGQARLLDGPPMSVELDASPEELSAMVAHLKVQWEQLGNRAPHWSVVVDPDFLPENIAAHESRFYETGHDPVHVLRRTAARCGVALDSASRCFELGCGVGRVTVWLAGEFAEVIGGDISQAHLNLATKALTQRSISNVRLVRLEDLALDAIPEFDVFVSVIVLQHNPPPVAAALLNMALRKLRPGGIAYFQVPTYGPAYAFSVSEYLAQIEKSNGMEMHILPQGVIFEILNRNGCDLVECRENDAVGDHEGFVSNLFFARKRRN